MTDTQMGRWPKYYTVVAMCVFAQLLAYFDRVNISVASLAMQETFAWDETTKGFVLSSFFIGYLAFQVIGGWLANRFGGRTVLGIALISWSIFTFFTPIAASVSLSLLIAVRIAMGAGEASLAPSAFNIFSRWAPEKEKATIITIFSAAATMGTLLALILTGWITQRYGWEMSFYIFGGAGIVLAMCWYKVIYANPTDHPKISKQELDLLPKVTEEGKTKGVIPWGQILSSPSVWGLFITYFCTSWGLYVFIAWLPSYFAAEQGLNISNAGIYSAAPWLSMSIFMVLGGWGSDYLINRGKKRIVIRKMFGVGGMIGSALALYLVRDAESAAAAMGLMVVALAFLSFVYAGVVPYLMDIAPEHSDILYGFTNTIGTLPGIIGIAIAGWLVQTTGTYDSVFALTAGIQIVGGLVFLFICRAERQIY